MGSLTKKLIKVAKKVIAIELDENMVQVLKKRFEEPNLEIYQEDILKVNLQELIKPYGTVKVVANLPYYITTPIVMRFLEENLPIHSITVMVQKEVGERFCADPGSKAFGAITVAIHYYSEARVIVNVPKSAFLPVPEVDSCVVKLDCLTTPAVIVKDEKRFFRLVKAAFSQKRKTINNSLAAGEFDKQKVLKVLEDLKIDSRLRAEDLSLQNFADIANALME